MQIFGSLLVLPLVACISAGPGALAATAQDAEELVWASVLTTFVADTTQRLLISEASLALPRDIVYDTDVLRRFPGTRPELVQNFIATNASGKALPEFASLDVPVERLSDEALAPFREAGDPDEYWEAFYSAYPKSPGLIRLSRVGFDPARQQALVFVSHSCGGRCGSGFFVLLSSAEGSWEVVQRSAVSAI